jgi:hypothetical protein
MPQFAWTDRETTRISRIDLKPGTPGVLTCLDHHLAANVNIEVEKLEQLCLCLVCSFVRIEAARFVRLW